MRKVKAGRKNLDAIFYICLLIILFSIVLSGCGKKADAAAEGKTLKIASGQTCESLDPTNAYDAWYLVRYGVCQTLTKMNDDLSVSGWLVEDGYSSNDDYTVWTFQIKEGVTFSNGDALTGEAVKESLSYVFANSVRAKDYFSYESIEAEGQTVTITTKEAEPILPNKLADPLFSIINTQTDTNDMAENGPIGTGPYIAESFDSTSLSCTVVKNQNYWGGKVKTDRIQFIYTEDQSTLTNSLRSGEVDGVYNLSMTDIGAFEEDSDYTIVQTASGRTTHGFMNQKGALGDQVLREAILQNLDKETYCSTLLENQYVSGKTLITSSADYGYEELTDPNAYNPDHAVELLDDNGYKDIDGDGYRETPQGEKLELSYTYYSGRPEQELLVEATCQEMAKIGIKIIPDLKDTASVMDQLASGDYDLLCMSINVLSCGDPENHLRSYFGEGGSYSTSGWNNTEFNSLLDQLSLTVDQEERKEITKEAEQLLLDDGVCIFYCYPLMNFVTKSNISGISCTPADYYWVSEDTEIS